MDRRSRGLARALVMPLVLGVVTAALVAAGACLPDLAAIPADDAALPPIAPTRYCGDDLIAVGRDGGDAGESCDPGDASVLGCVDCRITCEGYLDPKSGHCYFAAGTDDSLVGAQGRCKDKNAHVVTFASTQELQLVEQKLGGAGYWMGLEPRTNVTAYVADRREEPGYPFAPSGPCPGCFGAPSDGGAFSGDVSTCIGAANGSWFGVPCMKAPALRTICEREPVGSRSSIDDCFVGVCFSIPSRDDKQFVVVLSPTDQANSGAACSEVDGGMPAVFESPEEREQAAHEVLQRLPENVELWIGLVENGGQWLWADGKSTDPDGGRPAPWGNAQPTSAAGARAFLRFSPTNYDTQLAYTDPSRTATRLFLCQHPTP